MSALSFVLLALAPCAPPAPATVQEVPEPERARGGDPGSTQVLRQDGENYVADDVLQRIARYDDSLMPALEGNEEYFRLYLDSPTFYDHVRHFSNLLVLDEAGVTTVSRAALLQEAAAWAVDRGREAGAAEALLAAAGLEIEVRARLLAEQPEEFSQKQLRQHFLSSVPEFFGHMELSWIRLPLFNMQDGSALSESERHARYELLDEVAGKLNRGELSWSDAVETYCEDPVTSERGGRVGWVQRTDVQRFDPQFLRQVFADLGYRMPEGTLLRGPIFGSRWVYLARIKSVLTKGVVDMELVKDRVARSLREKLLHERLRELSEDVERSILLPAGR